MHQPTRKSQLRSNQFCIDLVSGGLSGIVSKTVAAPIERVKLLLQTQQVNKDVAVLYRGPIDCFRRVYREQGLSSFWRGNVANLLRYFPTQAFSFAFKDFYKSILGLGISSNANNDKLDIDYNSVNDQTAMNQKFWKFFWGNIFAAGAAGGTSMLLLYPLEMARTRLAADVSTYGHTRKFSGTFDCLRQIYDKNGIRGLYAGMPVALFGVVLFRGLYMGGYDISKSVLGIGESSAKNSSVDTNSGSAMADLLSRLGVAQAVTTVSGTLCYPLDTIRRRIMMQAKERTGNLPYHSTVHVYYYKNSWHCFTRIVKEEGAHALFHGLGVNLVRGMSGSLLLVGYDELRSLLERWM